MCTLFWPSQAGLLWRGVSRLWCTFPPLTDISYQYPLHSANAATNTTATDMHAHVCLVFSPQLLATYLKEGRQDGGAATVDDH